MTCILASASPRRRELLGAMGLPFTVLTAQTEESLPNGTPPVEGVRILAVRKASAVAALPENETVPVIGADTLVDLGGTALGKPRDAKEAAEMLRALSGKWHAVHTGVAVCFEGRVYAGVETTDVRFRTLDEREIAAYVATGEPLDKAGAYGIQGGASAFVAEIKGNLDCVIGLPATLLTRLLREVSE